MDGIADCRGGTERSGLRGDAGGREGKALQPVVCMRSAVLLLPPLLPPLSLVSCAASGPSEAVDDVIVSVGVSRVAVATSVG